MGALPMTEYNEEPIHVKMMSIDAESMYNDEDEQPKKKGTMTDNGGGEMEGMSPYAKIEGVLQEVYKSEYTDEYLQRFRVEFVDDAKLFDDEEFIQMFPMNHEIWRDLLPERAVRFDFFRKMKARTAYGDV